MKQLETSFVPALRAPSGRKGAVATAHPLATEAGIAILEQGGNAMDAANAAAAVLGVVQPMMSGLGGDSFVLHYEASSGRVHSISGAGPAPLALSPQFLCERGHASLPARGLLSASVPGAPHAMWLAHQRFGSGRLGMPAVLARAVELAAQGAPVAPFVARFFKINEAALAASPTAREAYLPEGRAPAVGDVLRQPALAATLSRFAELGPEDFHRGEFARKLVAFSQEGGGAFSAADLEACEAEEGTPISVHFGASTVFSNPPVAQGVVLLQALGLLERCRQAGAGRVDTDALKVHRMIESLKLAFAQRNACFGDPRFVRDFSAEVLRPSALSELAALISDEAARESLTGTRWSFGEGDTTALVASDSQGNVVSYITSLSTPFGAMQVVPGTGVLLNNRVGRGFSMDPGSPNALQGGKRTMSTLHTYLALDEAGQPVLAGCTSGGDGQPQWNLQIIDAVLNEGASVEAAVAMPRWELSPGTDPASVGQPYEILVDPRLDGRILDGLAARGHRISDKPLGLLGAAQVLSLDRKGEIRAAADPRADGTAVVLA